MYKNLVKLKDLRMNLDKYLAKLSKVGTLTVIRRSEPIFNISAIDSVDDELWETVADFTKLKKGGVEIKEILARL